MARGERVGGRGSGARVAGDAGEWLAADSSVRLPRERKEEHTLLYFLISIRSGVFCKAKERAERSIGWAACHGHLPAQPRQSWLPLEPCRHLVRAISAPLLFVSSPSAHPCARQLPATRSACCTPAAAAEAPSRQCRCQLLPRPALRTFLFCTQRGRQAEWVRSLPSNSLQLPAAHASWLGGHTAAPRCRRWPAARRRRRTFWVV